MGPLVAGAAYVAIVFAVGFALGTVRVIALEPAVGAFAAVAIEAPFMLTAAWFACGWVIRSLGVPRWLSARLVMGLSAFSLLIAAEFALAVFAFARPPADFASALLTPPGLLGLAAQMVFAAFPALRLLGQFKAGPV